MRDVLSVWDRRAICCMAQAQWHHALQLRPAGYRRRHLYEHALMCGHTCCPLVCTQKSCASLPSIGWCLIVAGQQFSFRCIENSASMHRDIIAWHSSQETYVTVTRPSCRS